MKKTIFAFVFSLLSLTTYAAFTDVNDHLHSNAIIYVQSQGIVSGYGDGTFKPDATINRVELLKILIEAIGPSPTACDMVYAYTDVEAGSWYDPYLEAALCRRIAQGYEDKTFRPGNPVNFAEASKMVVKAYQIPEPQYFRAPDNWYDPYIDAIASRGATPTDGIKPGDALTRGQMAEMIYRLKSGDDFIEASTEAEIDSLMDEIFGDEDTFDDLFIDF